MPTAIWMTPNTTVRMRTARSCSFDDAVELPRAKKKSFAAAVAHELRELDRVDMAAAKMAPSRMPSTPIGISSRMKRAKTRSGRSKTMSGAKT